MIMTFDITSLRPGKVDLLFRIMQSLSEFACGRAFIIHYLVVANAIHSQQIDGTTAIKSGRARVWMAIMQQISNETDTDAKQYLFCMTLNSLGQYHRENLEYREFEWQVYYGCTGIS